ncbi:unnamed protein product [Musa hybrid cultivar]
MGPSRSSTGTHDSSTAINFKTHKSACLSETSVDPKQRCLRAPMGRAKWRGWPRLLRSGRRWTREGWHPALGGPPSRQALLLAADALRRSKETSMPWHIQDPRTRFCCVIQCLDGMHEPSGEDE